MRYVHTSTTRTLRETVNADNFVEHANFLYKKIRLQSRLDNEPSSGLMSSRNM